VYSWPRASCGRSEPSASIEHLLEVIFVHVVKVTLLFIIAIFMTIHFRLLGSDHLKNRAQVLAKI